MNEDDAQILAARFELTLNAALAQLRIVSAHVAPVAARLNFQNPDRAYLVSGLMELTNLHAYLMQQLGFLLTGLSDPSAAAQALAAQALAATLATNGDGATAAGPDSEITDITVH